MLRNLGQFLLHIFFPDVCFGCGKIGSFLCSFCYEQLYFYTLPVHIQVEHQYIDIIIAATHYQPPISHLIKALKYQHMKYVAPYCAQLLFHTVDLPAADYITAVPITPQRQKERGFNQSEEIAEELAKLYDLPYLKLLHKEKQTVAQAKIHDRQKRMQNLSDAFSFIGSETILNKTILIIDDVTTTGTTLNECAKLIKQQGATQVIGLTVAHGL